MEQFSNGGETLLNGGIDDNDTTLIVDSSASFPSAGDFRVRIEDEILLVTNVSGTTWTVTRGAESSVAAAHADDSTITHVLTKGSLEGIVGNMVQTGVYASRPAAGVPGRWYLPTNGPVIFYDDGSDWHAYGPCFPFTPPVDANFAWVNQGSAAVVDSHGTIRLLAPGGQGSSSLRIRKKAAPSTPYTITAAFIADLQHSASPGCGLVWRDNAGGELTVFAYLGQNALDAKFAVEEWNSPTSYNNEPISEKITQFGLVIWFQMEDDGANRIVRWSWDGVNWVVLRTVARTTHHTPDEVGFYVNSHTTSEDATMTLLSWKET